MKISGGRAGTLGPDARVRSYAEILDALPIAAFVAEPDGRISYVSRGWMALTNHSASDVLDLGYQQFFEPDDVERVMTVWNAAAQSASRYRDEFRLRFGDGTLRWVFAEAAPLRDKDGAVAAWFGTIVDIDDRKRAEDALRTSEATYRALSSAIPGVTWAAAPSGELTYVGDRWIEIHGQPLEGALGDSWLASVHPEDRERVLETWGRSLSAGTLYDTEFRVRLADGSYRWFLVRALPVRDRSGEIERWFGVNIDIEERRRAHEQRHMYQALIENSSDFVGISDADGNAVYVNEAGRALLEIDAVGGPNPARFMEFFLPEDRPFVEAAILPTLEQHGRWAGDFQFRNFRTGTAVPVAYNVFTLDDSDGKPFGLATVSRDLRERKRVERGLRLLARTGAAVLNSLDYGTTLRNIAEAFVGGFASFCIIEIRDADGELEPVATHRQPELVSALILAMSKDPTRTGDAMVVAIDDNYLQTIDADRAEAIRTLGIRSIAVVPVLTPDGVRVGALTCGIDATASRENYTSDDLFFVQEVGRRAGAAIANARLYEHERRIAVQMQAASLPAVLPDVSSVQLDAEYRPGSAEATIGGDWYDAFVLEDGRIALTVGDVLGHGLSAAVTMTKLRQAMQAAAMVRPDPITMLDVAEKTLSLIDADGYATSVAAIYDPRERTLVFANAGHPPPLMRSSNGRVEELLARGISLGLRTGEVRYVVSLPVPAGSTIIFFTDGLIEATRDIDVGQRLLVEALEAGDIVEDGRPARAIVERVLRGKDADDDVALLILRTT